MTRPNESVRTPVAIIGWSCRVAGAETPDAFWRLQLAGERRIAPVPPGRWAGLDTGQIRVAQPHAALIEGIDRFDAAFFGISRRLAAWTDPQQRMLLELAWHALESAGIDPDGLRGAPVAMFAAACMTDYRERMTATGVVDGAAFPGTLTTFMANRISYQFDWTGPSLAVDSACASGLSIVSLAVAGLQNGEFPLAMVGGANTTSNGFYSSSAYRAGALSPTGTSVPFSARHDGYIRGEGGATLVLKLLPDALRDGDPIHGVIRSVGLAHDGRGGGLTATDADSQTRLMRRVTDLAGIQPAELGYLEAHGTGTGGDMVEVAGLRAALETDGRMPNVGGGPGGKVWIGSVKANIGHLEAAAGLLGIVKAAMVLHYDCIPAIPGLNSVEPALPLAGSPLAIADHMVRWPRSLRPRLAAVNSFGVGGALAHAVLEEPPLLDPLTTKLGQPIAIPLSAATPIALRRLAGRLAERLAAPDAPGFAEVAWTLCTGRCSLAQRYVLVAEDLGQLTTALAAVAAGAAQPQLTGISTHAMAKVRTWLDGGSVDWSVLWPMAERPRRVELVAYPFERHSFWFDRNTPPNTSSVVESAYPREEVMS